MAHKYAPWLSSADELRTCLQLSQPGRCSSRLLPLGQHPPRARLVPVWSVHTRALLAGTERGARAQVDVDAQLQERGRARALAAAVSLEQDGRQARAAMAACRQDMEARARIAPAPARDSLAACCHQAVFAPALVTGSNTHAGCAPAAGRASTGAPQPDKAVHDLLDRNHHVAEV